MKQAQPQRKSRARGNNRKPGRSQSGGNKVENKVRGNPKQLLDKYKTAAREARQSGDRVQAEYNLQFADHYQRVMNEMRLGCGGVFEEYREVKRRPREEREESDEHDLDGSFSEAELDGGLDAEGEQPADAAPPVLKDMPAEEMSGDDGEPTQRRGRGRRGPSRRERADAADQSDRRRPRPRRFVPDGAPTSDASTEAESVAPKAATDDAVSGVGDATPDIQAEEAPKPRRRGRPRKVDSQPALELEAAPASVEKADDAA